MSEVKVYSGGATGADALWIESAHEQGCQIEIETFEGHKRTVNVPCKLNIITQESLFLLSDMIQSTASRLGRRVDMRPFVYNLIARNYFIIENAQVVYAVGYLNTKHGLGIDGGTAWGCEYFKELRGMATMLYFFDMVRSKWFKLQINEDGAHEWLECSDVPSPKQFERVALIGSRELTPEGKLAIQQVW